MNIKALVSIYSTLVVALGVLVVLLVLQNIHINNQETSILTLQREMKTTNAVVKFTSKRLQEIEEHFLFTSKEIKIDLDELTGKVEILDEAIHGRDKRKARITKAISVIKETLPSSNPIPKCPKTPTPGELWSIAGAIIDNADEYAVPASLIAAVIRQESAFCNVAVSNAGARGYMQLMPETAAEVSTDMATKSGRALRVWRGRDNIELGTAYLSQMILEFEGNIELAVKAYNSGPIHIKKVLAGERILYKETEDYVSRVLAFKREYEMLGLQ